MSDWLSSGAMCRVRISVLTVESFILDTDVGKRDPCAFFRYVVVELLEKAETVSN